MGRVKRGVVGTSRYARKLRQAIHEAAHDPEQRPVLISGEPGLGKDNITALIHYGSHQRRQLLIRYEPIDLQSNAAALLDNLGDHSVLINKVDQIEAPLRQRLIAMALGKDTSFRGRMLFTSESCQADLDGFSLQIRVPPLRVRRSDLGDWLRYFLRLTSRELGWRTTPEVPEAVVRRLQNHDFPDNLSELELLTERALRQTRQQAGGLLPNVLPEVVFWTGTPNQKLRFDLWRWRPRWREWMRAPQLWNALLYGVVSWLFVVVNLALWLGPQARADNAVLKLFWAWWWPLILLSFPLVGRLWCAVCPFMVWGRIAQQLTPWRKRIWPHGDNDRWAAPVLSAGFALILVWEEVWNLENTAWLSSCLLLLITAGAVGGSLLFEKRFWCRHLCPVGGMNGLFAKLSILELRAEAGTCSGSCSSYACFKGGPAEGEGLASQGCPLGTTLPISATTATGAVHDLCAGMPEPFRSAADPTSCRRFATGHDATERRTRFGAGAPWWHLSASLGAAAELAPFRPRVAARWTSAASVEHGNVGSCTSSDGRDLGKTRLALCRLAVALVPAVGKTPADRDARSGNHLSSGLAPVVGGSPCDRFLPKPGDQHRRHWIHRAHQTLQGRQIGKLEIGHHDDGADRLGRTLADWCLTP